MRSNTDLTPREFEISFQIKMALHMLSTQEPLAAKENLMAALNIIYGE